MGYRIENNCAGCPTYCVHCSRGRDYRQYFCDRCGDNADDALYEFEGEELCFECVKESLISKICDDCDDETCADCGYDAETLYQYQGEWLCADCLEERLEKVEVD